MAGNGSPILTDGSLNFQGGVDSLKPTTVATQANPGGLARNELAWLINGSVRDGGIIPRAGWQPIYKILNWTPALAATVGWQGGIMYEPLGENPYVICSLGGEIYKVDPNAGVAVNLSIQFNLHNPTNVDHAYFVQGEQFVVIQAGDGVTLPLFWDGTTLRRSNGLVPSGATSAYTLVSADNQPAWTVPVKGGTVKLTWTAIPPDGTTVQIRPHNSKSSYGDYTVTSHTGNELTLTKLDFNTAAFTVPSTQYDLFKVNPNTTTTQVSELPAGYAMDYFMQRIWYVFGDLRVLTAGDIAGSTASGTQKYNFTDSVLKVTENPLAIGGDGFRLPSNSGNIRALAHSKTTNASLGQGQLYIFTRKQVYGLNPPVTRADWISTTSTNAPLLTVVQMVNGAVGDRCIVAVHGDLYFQTILPAIASIINAVRYYGQPGDVPISAPENRILQFNNRELLSFATGIEFDNRMLQSALPKRLPQGVVHQAVLPLDFTPVSSPGSDEPPTWQGHYEGLDILQMFTGDFGGLQRAFAFVVSRTDGSVWLWELTQGSLTENGDNRITSQIEFPAFNWGDDFSLKNVQGGELWIDRLSGTVEFNLEYRPDGYACYIPWIQWKECSSRDCEENVPPTCLPPGYPPVPATLQGLGYRQTIGFPKPPVVCDKQMNRPSDICHQLQCRLTIRGSCRVRGFFLHATRHARELYSNVPCAR